MRLVVFELANHILELLSTLLQVLLVNLEFFSDLWSRLLGQDVFQLNVELLFLLDEHVLLRDLLSLGDEPLLERLDLLDHLVSFWVSALEFPPPVHIEWLLELIREVLGLLLLLKVLLLEQINLPLEIWDASSLELRDDELPLQLRDLLPDIEDISELLLIVNLSLLEGGLLDLDLLIEESKLLVSLDELCSEDIPLVDDHLVVLALLLLLGLSFRDDVLEPGDIRLLGLNHLLRAVDVPLDLLDVLSQARVSILVDLLLLVLLRDGIVLREGLLLEL